MQKPPWELASIGSISPGRVDVVSILKLWRRVPVRTCVAVGTDQAPAAAGQKRQQPELPHGTFPQGLFRGG